MPTIPVYFSEKEYKELQALGIHEQKKVSELIQFWVRDFLKREGVIEQ